MTAILSEKYIFYIFITNTVTYKKKKMSYMRVSSSRIIHEQYFPLRSVFSLNDLLMITDIPWH